MNYQERRAAELGLASRKSGLTPEQVNYITDAMKRTWQAVGMDWLQMFRNQTCRRCDVVEAVTDADRMLSDGKPHVSFKASTEEKEAARKKHKDMCELYYNLDDKKRKIIDKFAFPDNKYGM